MIHLSNVSKKYGEHEALKSIDLDIESGTIFGLLGPNGAGKTTLMSILVGLTGYDTGTVNVDGKDISESLAYIQSISSHIPQNLAFYPTLTARENLEFFGGMWGFKGADLKARITYVMHVTKLDKVFDKQAHTYSGGLKRRLNIAIGLLSDPKIIYFDEPTVGIDPQSRNFILESIKAMKDEDKVIVYTSHYMEEVEFLCDKIAIMDHGKIIKTGSLDTLFSEFKATIKTPQKIIQLPLSELSLQIKQLQEDGQEIKSIEYGHNLENYFLQLTHKEARD